MRLVLSWKIQGKTRNQKRGNGVVQLVFISDMYNILCDSQTIPISKFSNKIIL